MSSDGPIFILGLGRAGTSVLMNILNRTGEVCLLPESHVLDLWYPIVGDASLAGIERERLLEQVAGNKHVVKLGLSRGDWTSRVPDPCTLGDVLAALMLTFAGPDVRLGDKTPAFFPHIEALLAWFPEAFILFTIRDPRGYLSSLARLDDPWAQGSLMRHMRQWNRTASAARKWAGHPQIRVLRYEDLVSADPAVLRSIGSFLSVEVARSIDESARPQQLSHGSLRPTDAGLSAERIHAWKETLSEDEVALVQFLTRRHLAHFGYEGSDSVRLPVGGLLKALLRDVPLRLRGAKLRVRRSWGRFAVGRRRP